MGWKYICCGSVSIIDTYTTYSDYHSAGLHFVEKGRILIGEQPRKKVPCMSGLGGKKTDADESSVYTAYRETIEELCGITVTNEIIMSLITNLVLVPQFTHCEAGYVYYVLEQKDLHHIMNYVWRMYKGHVEHYIGDNPPKSIDQIIGCRVYTDRSEVCRLYNVEIEKLLILSIGGSFERGDGKDVLPLPLDPYLVDDLKIIQHWQMKDMSKKLKSTTKI